MNEQKMDQKQAWNEEELIKRVETAAREGAFQGAKEGSSKIELVPRGGGKLIAFIVKVVIVVALISAVSGFVASLNPITALKNLFSQEADVEDHDLTLENNGILGYKAADFAEVILGDSSKLNKLEVYSQEMSQMVQLTKAGLGKLKIFSKSKYYTYHGTATYTVDLSKLTADSITLDEETLTVTLAIPHAELEEPLNVPQDEIEIGDTTKGLLAFGDLNMTDEESQELMARAREDMKEKLEETNAAETADQMAKMAIWELYQPLITNMAPGYSLNVEFAAAE